MVTNTTDGANVGLNIEAYSTAKLSVNTIIGGNSVKFIGTKPDNSTEIIKHTGGTMAETTFDVSKYINLSIQMPCIGKNSGALWIVKLS